MQAQPTEAELAELKVKEEDARIAAELPELKVTFAKAPWELEVRFDSAIQYHLRVFTRHVRRKHTDPSFSSNSISST